MGDGCAQEHEAPPHMPGPESQQGAGAFVSVTAVGIVRTHPFDDYRCDGCLSRGKQDDGRAQSGLRSIDCRARGVYILLCSACMPHLSTICDECEDELSDELAEGLPE
jgi:hypothetical protein